MNPEILTQKEKKRKGRTQRWALAVELDGKRNAEADKKGRYGRGMTWAGVPGT